jgi:hypothetical protein
MWREDEWFQELDVEARLFWIYLFTNPSASPAGIYRLPLRTMAFESGVSYEAAQDLMRRFAADGKAQYEDGIVWVVNMRRLQFPTLVDGSREWQTAIRIQRDIDAIPDRCAMKAQYLAHSGYPIVVETTENGKPIKRVSIQYPNSSDTPPIPHRYSINTPSVNKTVTVTETVTETPTETAASGRDEFRRQYESVLGMVPTASYPEMTTYMDRLTERNVSDWWGLALQQTTQARVPGWHYMKACLESWLAAGQPSTNTKTNGHSQDADTRPRVKAPPSEAIAAADARQAAYERQVAEELARAGRLQ